MKAVSFAVVMKAIGLNIFKGSQAQKRGVSLGNDIFDLKML